LQKCICLATYIYVDTHNIRDTVKIPIAKMQNVYSHKIKTCLSIANGQSLQVTLCDHKLCILIASYMTAAIIQHNNTAMTQLYSVVDPDPSASFIRLQSFVVFRGLSTITGFLTS